MPIFACEHGLLDAVCVACVQEGGWEGCPFTFGVEGGHRSGQVPVEAMDGASVDAVAFSLGTKKVRLSLPWDTGAMRPIFGSAVSLVTPPVWVPMARSAVDDEAAHVQKVSQRPRGSWTVKTSLCSWPLVEEAKLAKAIEQWRVIVLDSGEGTLLGRQLMSVSEDAGGAAQQILSDVFAGKSISTLKARASALLMFGRWKKSRNAGQEVSIFPTSEPEVYKYLTDLRKEGAPRSRAPRFLQALGFSKGFLGADVDHILQSARIKGATVSDVPLCGVRKKDPLTVQQLFALEQLAFYGEDHEAIFAGYICFLVHCRLRWSDGQFCNEEPVVERTREFGSLECNLYHHKTSGRQQGLSKRLLPAAAALPGVSGKFWAETWLLNRSKHNLNAGRGRPTMPAPMRNGGWALTPLRPTEGSMWLRELLTKVSPSGPLRDIASHSCKSTCLSWMAKANAPIDLRRLAGYHVDPSSRSALEYSRDAQGPVLHFLGGLYLCIRQGFFLPDETRSGRWIGCVSFEDAMSKMAVGHVVPDAVEEQADPGDQTVVPEEELGARNFGR